MPEAADYLLTVPLASLFGIGGAFSPELPIGWRALCATIAILLVVVVFAGTTRHAKKLRRVTTIVLSVIILLTVIVVWAQRPSPDQRAVAAYYAETRDANFWQDVKPIMFNESQKFMEQHWSAFTDARPHQWDELGPGPALSVPSVIADANVVQGQSLTIVGVSNGVNQLGAELIMQLQPLEQKDVNFVNSTELASLVSNDADLVELSSDLVPSSHDSHLIAYCRFTPRPFQFGTPNDYYVVKAVVIAFGRTLRGDGTMAQVAYLACSAAEQFHPEDF